MTWRRYDDLLIGSRFPDSPARYVVTEEAIQAYRSISGSSMHLDESTGLEIAPPTLAAIYIRPAQNALHGPPGGIHAKQSFQFFRPVIAGDRLDTILEVMEKFERKGKRYVVSQTTTTNQAGTMICQGRITQIWGQDP